MAKYQKHSLVKLYIVVAPVQHAAVTFIFTGGIPVKAAHELLPSLFLVFSSSAKKGENISVEKL